MIKALRKRHLQIWTLWALLLPVAIVSAVAVRKKPVTDSSLQVQNGKLLPVVIAEKIFDDNLIQLRGNAGGAAEQFVWINKEPLKVASAAVYRSPTEAAPLQSSTYLGRIETRGDYVFALSPPKASLYCFIVYDFIHGQEIGRLHFNLDSAAHRQNIPQ